MAWRHFLACRLCGAVGCEHQHQARRELSPSDAADLLAAAKGLLASLPPHFCPPNRKTAQSLAEIRNLTERKS